MSEIRNLTLEERVTALESALNTTATANINSIAALVTILHSLPSFDSAALEKELVELKSLPSNVEPVMYGNLLDMLIFRLRAPKT